MEEEKKEKETGSRSNFTLGDYNVENTHRHSSLTTALGNAQ